MSLAVGFLLIRGIEFFRWNERTFIQVPDAIALTPAALAATSDVCNIQGLLENLLALGPQRGPAHWQSN